MALEGLSLGATYAVYLTWFLTSYHSSQLAYGGYRADLFWIVFYALDVWRIGAGRPTFQALRERVASANIVAYYACMFASDLPLASKSSWGLSVWRWEERTSPPSSPSGARCAMAIGW